MFKTNRVLCAIAAAAISAVALAGPVQLDISSYFNYDAVGTTNEISYCNTFTDQNHRLDNILGQHNLRYGQCYSDADLPADGMLADGYYQFGKGLDTIYDVPAGDTAQANSVYLNANNSVTSVEIALDASQQQQYSDINFLLNGYRYGTNSAGVTYGASVEVKYAGDDNWYSIWSEQADGSVPGGSFTSGGAGGMGHFYNDTDTETWSLAQTMTKYVSTAGSDPNRYSRVLSGERYMWEYAVPLDLDETQVLESIRMTVSTTGVNRNNSLWLFGATANAVPEPATLMLLAGGMVAVVRRRK